MIVVDTHVVIWLALKPTEISGKALVALTKARSMGGLAIVDVSLWEIAQTVSRGRVELESSLRDFLRDVEASYRVLPVTGPIAERGMQFSERYPRDPFDRMIGAAAVMHGMELVTRDEQIRASGEVPCVW